jgi:hypothetical protein
MDSIHVSSASKDLCQWFGQELIHTKSLTPEHLLKIRDLSSMQMALKALLSESLTQMQEHMQFMMTTIM